MLSVKLLHQTKYSMFAAQRSISFNALSKCVNQFNVASRLGNKTLTKPLLTAPIIARFTGSTAAVKTGKNYASLWRAERVVSIALMGLFPAAVLYSSPIIDTLLAGSISLHVYWGLEALVVDYLRVPVVGKLANKAGHATITLLAIVTLAGFLQVIFVGDGLGNAIVQLWKL
ncbi:succinate dehydrogenase [ubiquinone] cytochrome b small subunit, mitochondrial [Rhopalosiphum maidis]|uniref:succinate dehydrogenase [ubiquinone] cytochrome b small subunit, mitochondrial n=1 Tax=Rhopalosiphum maidis TaxID=43146 RepID=UPI000EFE9D55|nr:succinate dehydrogenase [ubiquinone] cytochrome b small subunit, mitochondrial [Rhopalosiphum maidis]